MQRNAAALGFDRNLLHRPPVLRGQRGVGGADPGLLVREPRLVQIRQESGGLATRAVQRIDGAALAGDSAVVGIEQHRCLGLRDAARQRLLVHAREIAPGAGEHAIDLIADVVLENIEIRPQGGIGRRIEIVAARERRERGAVLIVRRIDSRRAIRTAAGKQRVGHAADAGRPRIASGRIGRQLSERARFGGGQIR